LLFLSKTDEKTIVRELKKVWISRIIDPNFLKFKVEIFQGLSSTSMSEGDI
jgi:hypothetical protein